MYLNKNTKKKIIQNTLFEILIKMAASYYYQFFGISTDSRSCEALEKTPEKNV